MPSTGSSLVWRESSRQTRLGRGGSLIGTGEVQAPIQVALLCEEQHNHLAVPRGKGGEGCQGSEKTEGQKLLKKKNASLCIYLRHPWPSRSTGRNIEDAT